MYGPRMSKTENRDITSSKPAWAEFTLEDGTVLRVKTIIIDAKRCVGEYDDNGNPKYNYTASTVLDVIAPPELMQPATMTAQTFDLASRGKPAPKLPGH